jgi:hypothetical protein
MIFSICGFAADKGEKFIYDPKGKRDPFLPLVSPEGYLINIEPLSSVSEIKVEGIIYDPYGNSFAIINSEVVKPKDKIGSFEVLEIKKDSVILLKDQKKYEMRLKEGN